MALIATTAPTIDTRPRIQFSLRALLVATAICGLILTLLVNNMTAWAVECLIILGFFLLSYLASCHFGASRSTQDREVVALMIMGLGLFPGAVYCALDECLVGGLIVHDDCHRYRFRANRLPAAKP